MSQWIRRCTTAAATVLAFSAVPCRRNSDPRGCQRRRLRQRRAAHLGKRVRQHRRRSRPLRSAAGLLRANAVRPPPPPNVSGCASYNGRWVNASGCN